jgi:hypothetical protein
MTIFGPAGASAAAAAGMMRNAFLFIGSSFIPDFAGS